MTSEQTDDDFDLAAELDALGIDANELDATLERLADDAGGFDEIWEPRPGFADRVTTGALQRIGDREAALALADLFGLAILTAKEMMNHKDSI